MKDIFPGAICPNSSSTTPTPNMLKKLVNCALMLLLAAPAHATFECNVKIQRVLIYDSGVVNVLHSGRGDYTHVCNLNVERQGVSPVVCANWVAMLQHIKRNNYWASFWFNGTGSCATLPTYDSSPAPVYIGNTDL